MKKATLLTAVSLVLLLGLCATTAMATENLVLWQTFNRTTHTGSALIQINDNLWALIQFIDMDRSGDFTPGDIRIRTRYLSDLEFGG